MPIVKSIREHKLLLDTHVWLVLVSGDTVLSRQFIKAADQAALRSRLFISAISVWEIGMLAEKKRIVLDKDPLDWVEMALQQFGFSFIPLTPRIAIESTRLPEQMHADPADRILIATAREQNAVLVTYDAKLLGYANNHYFSAHDPRA